MEALAKDDEDDPLSRLPQVRIPYISTEALEKVLEFCADYQDTEAMRPFPKTGTLDGTPVETLVQQWYVDFIQQVDRGSLLELVVAAELLKIPTLFELALRATVRHEYVSLTGIRFLFDIPEEGRLLQEKE